MSGVSAATMGTPDGNFTMLLRDGAVLASGWTSDTASLLALVHPTLRPAILDVEQTVYSADRNSHINYACAAVAAYYDGDLGAPGRIPVLQYSAQFRMQAWETLRRVAPGERITYTEYAHRARRPAAVRAAAAACALNAAALFVPCHRVLRSDGGLGGFRYGLDIKQRLLGREATGEPEQTLF